MEKKKSWIQSHRVVRVILAHAGTEQAAMATATATATATDWTVHSDNSALTAAAAAAAAIT
jgi:hypothetical protein